MPAAGGGAFFAVEIVGGANPGEKRDMGSVVAFREGCRDLLGGEGFLFGFFEGVYESRGGAFSEGSDIFEEDEVFMTF